MRLELSDAVVMFDLDGTLIDTAGDLAAAMNHALTAAGRETVDAGEVRNLVGRGARAMLIRGFERTGGVPDDAEIDAAFTRFLEYYVVHIADSSRPFPGAVAAIDDLRGRGAKIAICTNKPESPARRLIEALDLSARFDAIVGVDSAAAPKPDPAPVRRCLELTAAIRGVFIGDSDTDIRAAAAAGLPCLIGTFGYGPLTLREKATAAFGDYSALSELVRVALSSD